MRDHRVLVLRFWALGQGLQRLFLRRGDLAAAGGRHDRSERAHAVWMVERDALRDHSAHRRADHMRLLDSQCIEQAGRVRRHIRQGIGRLDFKPQLVPDHHLEDARRLRSVHLLAQADIAIVEPDDAKAARRQRIEQFVGPQRHLRAEPVDQQDRRSIGRPPLVIFERDPIGFDLRHAFPLSRPVRGKHCPSGK